MAWLKIESSVARNRKFVKAGPAPSWLWVCGLAYCQEGLTDGFIPTEALEYLGVKNSKQLAAHLVTAGLWDVVEGGWQVHDYLEHNRSQADVEAIRQARRDAGAEGGRASGESRRKQRPKQTLHAVEANPKQPSNPSTATATDQIISDQRQLISASVGSHTEFPGDVWWSDLIGAYPQNRVMTGHLVNKAFIDALLRSADGPHAAWQRMRDNLENQKRGHEWRIKGMVPSLQKWLESGAWEQRHDEAAPVVEQLSPRTSRTLAAAASILRRPQ